MKRSSPLPEINYQFTENTNALESIFDYLFQLVQQSETCNLTDEEL